jgi:hypothetical protein
MAFGAERIFFGMIEIINGQIDIQFGPIEMEPVPKLDIKNRPDRHVFEIREFRIGKEVFFAVDQHPDAERRDVFNAG